MDQDDDILDDDFRDEDVDLDEEDEDAVADEPTEDESETESSEEEEDDHPIDSEAATPAAESPHSLQTSPLIPDPPSPVQQTVGQPPPPPSRPRSLSPARIRVNAIKPTLTGPFTVEAVCAIPQPAPTHSLAFSACASHLLTGSDDGYIRDYDIFSSLNGKTFLSAPQRHHAGVVEGSLKACQVRCWWENPPTDEARRQAETNGKEPALSPVFSMTMESSALWAAAGTDSGQINLFTVRHEPGYRFHSINRAHNGPVSSMCLDYDETGLLSAGWDGSTIHWDLNTGQEKRRFKAHGAQLSTVALNPAGKTNTSHDAMQVDEDFLGQAAEQDADAKSDTSFDPLFDDPDPEMDKPTPVHSLAMPSRTLDAPKNAPPLLTSDTYQQFSSELLLTAAVDGQVILWDCRMNSPGKGAGRLPMNEKTPPWCMSACWSSNGSHIYAGRRNGTIDIWDVRQLGRSGPSGTPRMFKTLRNPLSSGVVSCVAALPDNRHLACASIDNLRLWDVEASESDPTGRLRGAAQFKIIPGHHGGYISQLLIDRAGRFLVSASSNRGWHGDSTRTVFVHDIKRIN